MRIVMPLFKFNLEQAKDYAFDGDRIFIAPFDKKKIPKIQLFSEQDLRHMSEETSWALVYDDTDIKRFRTKVNLILLAFKIFCEKRYPFLKYRICVEDHSLCARLNDTITYNYSFPRTSAPFVPDDLTRIRDGFLSLVEMEQLSTRTHNALYFLYRAWNNTKWMDSFIFMMCTLESLFSKDKPGGATAAITTRVSSLLGSKQKCTKKDIKYLYDLRSRITHGNIEASDDPGDNLAALNHLEYITIQSIRSLVHNNFYKEYSKKESRDILMSRLNTST